MNEANICESNVSVRTVGRFLNSKGYYGTTARKKNGLLTNNEKSLHVAFAKKVREQYDKESGGTSSAFAHKTNPLDKARPPTGRIYRKNQKVSTSIAQRQGVQLDLEER